MSSPSPSSLTLVTGGTTTFTETFQPQNGFNSSVSLSYTGRPAGLTFSPSSPTLSGSLPINQTITATASTATAPGDYTITITASGGGATQTATLPVSVQTFTISPPSPTSLTLGQGANTTFVETFQAQNGFSSSVSRSYSGGPSGLIRVPSPFPAHRRLTKPSPQPPPRRLRQGTTQSQLRLPEEVSLKLQPCPSPSMRHRSTLRTTASSLAASTSRCWGAIRMRRVGWRGSTRSISAPRLAIRS